MGLDPVGGWLFLVNGRPGRLGRPGRNSGSGVVAEAELLLDEVYQWLREEFRSMFGRELWGQ